MMKNHNTTLGNLFILGVIPQLWLRKILANIIGLLIAYPIILYNRESAFLLTLFFTAFVYKTLRKDKERESSEAYTDRNLCSDTDNDKESITQEQAQSRERQKDCFTLDSLVVEQCIASLFCICLVVFTHWQDFILKALFSCVFLRIYDYYKPSIISRLYHLEQNRILGFVLSGVLSGILSGISVMVLLLLLNRAGINLIGEF
ncbi:hypothetical protein [Helicobacter sp. MIT 14-3879]|uniref:hypothetical protein n=1 Tax=Helicobacter sp. MIT 14-3879 TaxID=2040649 RepID=UPI000E1E4BA1|nr:hypothetical protein [Helicobacter sp. MIT 14-3879]RDU61524.1 hypothetical protein CQA44_08665 [Helicobacter sp. MIT 14-3879]